MLIFFLIIVWMLNPHDGESIRKAIKLETARWNGMNGLSIVIKDGLCVTRWFECWNEMARLKGATSDTVIVSYRITFLDKMLI